MALLTETPGSPLTGPHVADHAAIARAVNARHGVVAAAPAAGATYQPDYGVGETHVVTLPAAGVVTIGAPVSADPVLAWLPGAELTILLKAPAGSTATVTWDAAYAGAPAGIPAPVVIVARFRNTTVDTGAPAWQWTAGPLHYGGPLANMPANGAWPDGSTWEATDQNGGTPWKMIAGAWVQEAPGVTQASGMVLAGPAQLTASFDVKAVGVTATDVTGMSIAVPASARPVLLRAKFEIQSNSGTAAAGAAMRIQVQLTDNANTVVDAGTVVYVQVTAAAVVFASQIVLERWLPAPVAAATYKVRAMLLAAAPANWTSAFLLPSNGSGATAADNLYALAA